MKKIFFLVLISFFVLFAGIAQAIATLPYMSWVEAHTILDYDEGPSYAYASDSYGDAEAWANGTDLGGRSYTTGSYVSGVSDGGFAETHSYFEQIFVVTAAGPAAINFSWNGKLEITGTEDTASGECIVAAFSIYAEEGFGCSKSDYNEIYGIGMVPVNDAYSFVYNFTEADVGIDFSVFFDLYTYVDARGYDTFSGENGSIEISSDFYDSFKITSIEGGLQAVPIPAAVWLLGSGLIGLVGVRRRCETNPNPS